MGFPAYFSGSFQIDMDAAKATVDGTKAEYLSGKTLSVTLNGQTKKITLGEITGTDNDAVVTALQEALNKSFGDGRITVEDKDGVITFSGLRQGDTFSVSSSEAGVSEMLFGEGNSSVTNYLDVSKSLGQLGSLEGDTLTFGGMQVKGTIKTVADKSEIVAKDDGTYTDKNGNLVDKDGNYLAKDGETPLYEFTMSVNGEDFTFTQDTALETVMNSINSNAEAGVNISYSKITNKFVFTAKDSGEAGRIEIGGDLGTALFGTVDTSDKDTYTAGQDAVFQAKVNGQTQIFTRSENTFDMDGLTVTLEGVFNNADRGADAQPIQSADADEGLFVEGEAVTFSTKTDTDTIVDAIKQMVEDYNAIVTEVKKAYSDMPLQQSNGSQYEPLTSDDEEGMTESEIEAYEEKAKTGILFMDRGKAPHFAPSLPGRTGCTLDDCLPIFATVGGHGQSSFMSCFISPCSAAVLLRLKLLMVCPMALPSFGSFVGPKINRAMPKISRSSVVPSRPNMVNTSKVNDCVLR